jgi:hypothetical protein
MRIVRWRTDARPGTQHPRTMTAGRIFDHIDRIAEGSLSRTAFERYVTYRDALIEDGQDADSTVATLSLFVWDLFEGRPGVADDNGE